jgi:hypothetical protein
LFMLSSTNVWSARLWGTLLLLAIPRMVHAGESVEVARGTGAAKPQQPQIAVDRNGAIHLVYGMGELVCYHRSDDGGKSFTDRGEVFIAPTIALGMRRGPRIAATGSTICVTAIGGKVGKGRDGDVLAVHSPDGGKSWSKPVRVNDVDDAAREGLQALASGPNGDLCCVWLDLRHGRTEIMAATSSSGGKEWTSNVLVYQSPDGSVCECCHPSVAFDEHGKIYVQWRNSLGGRRDIYMAVSSDSGRTFGPATRLGTKTWALDACPMDGGAIAISGTRVTSIWRREKQVYLSQVGQPSERSLGEGEQPWIAATPRGSFLIWLKQRGSDVYLLGPDQDQPIVLAHHAYDPVIAAGPKGQGPVVAAWESRDRQHNSILCRVVNED